MPKKVLKQKFQPIFYLKQKFHSINQVETKQAGILFIDEIKFIRILADIRKSYEYCISVKVKN